MRKEIRAAQVPVTQGGPKSRTGEVDEPPRPARHPIGFASGFTAVEMLIVIAVMAILLGMALPALTVLAPQYMVRSSAEGLASLMQKARLMANNTQKPIRVVLDCRANKQDDENSACTMRLYSANFDSQGDLDITAARGGWTEVPNSRREINNRVTVSIPDIPGDLRKKPGVVYSALGPDVYFAVFLPTGRVMVSHDPMRLAFSSEQGGGVPPRVVSLNKFSGRVTVGRR